MMNTVIGFGERPRRREPGTGDVGTDIYTATSAERAHSVQAAWDAGVRVFHAAYEREAASLGASLKTLGLRGDICLSTTDGDVLDRCPDTEAGGYEAVRGAVARKLTLLGTDTLDVFHLYDVRRETHTLARLAGARRALHEAQSAGHIGQVGATCYEDFEHLSDVIETGVLTPAWVVARLNFFDRRAEARLLPLCRERGVRTWAAQPFAWVGGVPFVRFPNTWRLRNLTQSLYGFSAGQAHLYWLLHLPHVDGVLVSMQSAQQVTENTRAAQLNNVPSGLESLFQSFVEMIGGTREGWRGLLGDDEWEWRAAAERFLGKQREGSA